MTSALDSASTRCRLVSPTIASASPAHGTDADFGVPTKSLSRLVSGPSKPRADAKICSAIKITMPAAMTPPIR